MSIVKGIGVKIIPPTSALVASPLVITGGLLEASQTYSYGLTFVTAYGETNFRDNLVSVTTGVLKPAVRITSIPIPVNNDKNIISKKIYRNTAAAPTVYKLVATISRNVETYDDLIADADLGVTAVEGNNADSRQTIFGYVKFDKPIIQSSVTIASPETVDIESARTTLTTDTGTVAIAKLPVLNANLVGVSVTIINDGTGSVDITAADGQTINNVAGPLSIAYDNTTSDTVVKLTAISATNWEADSSSKTVSANVRSFGAIGDGVTDDTAAFDAALASITKGELYIPVGVYILDNWTVNKSDVHIRGEGYGTVLKLKAKNYGDTSTPNNAAGLKVYSGTVGVYLENIIISNLKVDGNKNGAGLTATVLNNVECIDLIYCKSCIVRDCWVVDAMSDGFDLDSSEHCLVTNCYADDCGGFGFHIGIETIESGVSNSVARNCGANGLRGGFDTFLGTSDSYITNCNAFDCYRGITLNGFKSICIGCHVERSSLEGYNINGDECIVSSCVGDGNIVSNNTTLGDFVITGGFGSTINSSLSNSSLGNGIRVDTGITARISNCRVADAVTDGIVITNSEAAIINGNYVSDCVNGINLDATTSVSIITSNLVRTSTTGIFIRGTGHVEANNLATANTTNTDIIIS